MSERSPQFFTDTSETRRSSKVEALPSNRTDLEEVGANIVITDIPYRRPVYESLKDIQG